MTIVKELNELAEKMTGVNPKAKTDAQALNYIEQHYEGGQPSPTPQSKFDYIIPEISWDYSSSNYIDIENEEAISILNEISQLPTTTPLSVGCIFYELDQELNEFAVMVNRTPYALYFMSGSTYGYYITITRYGNKWVTQSIKIG